MSKLLNKMSKRSIETEKMDTKSDNEVNRNINSWLLCLFLLKDASTEESNFDSVKKQRVMGRMDFYWQSRNEIVTKIEKLDKDIESSELQQRKYYVQIRDLTEHIRIQNRERFQLLEEMEISHRKIAEEIVKVAEEDNPKI
jgi:hypothetical protein